MNNIKFFPTFHFYPLKLKETSERIQKRYPDGSQLPINLVRKRLPDLLAQIRQLSEGESEVKLYAETLKPIDINVLASGYPYEEEDLNTISKVMIILVHRYNRIVGRRFWQHFQTSPNDSKIIEMLVYIFDKADTNFMGFKESIRNEYNKIFTESRSGNTLKNIAIQIDSTFNRIEESFKDWRVEKDSLLDNELWLLILEHKMITTDFVKLQGAELIRDKLNNVSIDRYKQIIVNYLEALQPEEYNSLLFTQLIHRLDDPRKNLSRWSSLPEEVIKKVKQRLIRAELFNFFDSDSERFTYWSQYINHVEDVDYNEDPMIAAMYFGEFVVVEFAEKGNAAYFYEHQGFSRYLAHKNKKGINVRLLKEAEADYFINKLDHRGNWHSRYDDYMSNFLKGNLDYRH